MRARRMLKPVLTPFFDVSHGVLVSWCQGWGFGETWWGGSRKVEIWPIPGIAKKEPGGVFFWVLAEMSKFDQILRFLSWRVEHLQFPTLRIITNYQISQRKPIPKSSPETSHNLSYRHHPCCNHVLGMGTKICGALVIANMAIRSYGTTTATSCFEWRCCESR